MLSFRELSVLLRGEAGLSTAELSGLVAAKAPALTAAALSPRHDPAKASGGNLRSFVAEEGLAESLGELLSLVGEELDVGLPTAAAVLAALPPAALDDPNGLAKDQRRRKAFLKAAAEAAEWERRWAARCLCQVLQARQTPDGTVAQATADFVRHHLSTNNWLKDFLATLKSLSTAPPFGRAAPSGSLTLHSLRLQGDLLRCLLWHCHVAELSLHDAVAVLEALKGTRWGSRQPWAKASAPWTEEHQAAERSLNHLSLLLSLQLLEKESVAAWASASPSKASSAVRQLLEDAEAEWWLSGPLLAAWAVLLQSDSLPAEDKEGMVSTLGSVARELDVPGTLGSLLGDAWLAEDADLRQLAASVVFATLDGFLQDFEASSLGPWESLVGPLAAALREAPVAEDFWAREFQGGAAEWLRDLFYQFPYAWPELVPLLEALVSASGSSAAALVAFVQRLPFFTEDLATVTAAELRDVGQDDDQVFELTRDRRPYGPSGPAIPLGTRGTLVAETSVGPMVGQVRWAHFHNAWQLCLLYARALLRHQPDPDAEERGRQVLALVAAALRADAGTLGPRLVEFVNVAVALGKRGDEAAVALLAPAAAAFPGDLLPQLHLDSWPSAALVEAGLGAVGSGESAGVLASLLATLTAREDLAEMDAKDTADLLRLIHGSLRQGEEVRQLVLSFVTSPEGVEVLLGPLTVGVPGLRRLAAADLFAQQSLKVEKALALALSILQQVLDALAPPESQAPADEDAHKEVPFFLFFTKLPAVQQTHARRSARSCCPGCARARRWSVWRPTWATP